MNSDIDKTSMSSMSSLITNISLIIIIAIFLIYVLYNQSNKDRINFDSANVEGYQDSKSLLRPGTGPIGFSIPSSNLDKSLQGRYHLTQYEVDQAFGTEYSNVKLLSERVADIIADYTLRVIVDPCMNAENLRGLDARLDCIKAYPHYYTDILKYPLLDMFAKMDEYEINPFERGVLKREDQQHEAMIGLVQAYAKSLDESLKVMGTKYEELGFIPKEFKANLSYVLNQWFLFRLTQIFRNPDLKWSTLGNLSNDMSQVSNTDFDTDFAGLPKDNYGSTSITSGSYAIDCSDLNSDSLVVTLDGRRLRCDNAESLANSFYVNT